MVQTHDAISSMKEVGVAFCKAAMPGTRTTILVCDDEAAIRSIVATKLRHAGFEVIEGRHGLEGYCWCDHSALPEGSPPKSAQPVVPALVVTDLQMPMMSGLEMASKLKAFAPTANVPILMLTARGYILDREQLAQTNIKAFMAKPFGASQLLEQVQGLLALHDQTQSSLHLRGIHDVERRSEAA